MALAFEIFSGFAILVLILYYYFTAHFNFWKSQGVVGPEPTPVIGNVLKIMLGTESLADFVQRLYHKYKNEPMVGIFLRRTPVLVVQDPDLIKDVLIRDFAKFANRGFMKNEIAEPLSKHLFTLEVERWRPLRSHLSPVFTSGKLKGTFSLILECTKNLEKYLGTLVAKGEPIEVREVAARYTTDVIGSCAFGIEMNSLSENESDFRKMGKEIFATHWKAIIKFRTKECMSGLYDFLGYFLPYDEPTKFISRVTKETLEYRKANSIVRPDFMNALLELQKKETIGNLKLTDTLLAAQAFVFFAAGFETSSTTIANTLYELALNQETQKKLRSEIKEFNARNDGEWRYETIKEMSYLDKVFKETLRKYPPLAVLTRETTEEYTFEDTKVSLPKGGKVWIPVYALHMDPATYPDPEKFDPERFSEENVKSRHPMQYLPFGDGPRNCIGARFAVYQTKIGLIKILCNYKVDVCEKTMIPYEQDKVAFVTIPKGGLYLKVTKDES